MAPVKTIVRKQLTTLLLSFVAFAISAILAGLAAATFHVPEWLVGFPLVFILVGLVLKFGPDGWR